MAYVIGDDCIACGTCQGECPVEAISEGEKYSIINPQLQNEKRCCPVGQHLCCFLPTFEKYP